MKIQLGMPELLIVFSLVIYSQAIWFSIIAFCLGLSGRILSFCLEWQQKIERTKENSKMVSELAETLSGFANPSNFFKFSKKDKEFH